MKEKKVGRRTFLKTSLGIAGAGAVGIGSVYVADAFKTYTKNEQLPNILLITADNLGWQDLGCYGNSDVKTPNIDRLAREGALFNNAFVVSSSCSPSRASLITGKYPHTIGVNGLTHIYLLEGLAPWTKTLASHLYDMDYNTAMEGKWHVSPYLPVGWFGYNERLSGFMPEDMWITGTEKTKEFIQQNKNNRFYLELNYMNTHRQPDGEYHFDPDFPVDPESITIPDYWNLPDWDPIRLEVAKYYSQTMKMDAMIGEVISTLEENDILDQTLIVFLSDNGPHFPGGIMTLYDRGIKVPLIIRYPKRIPKDIQLNQLVNSIDIMPTLLEAVGKEIPQDVEGTSFFSIFTSQSDQEYQDQIFAEITYHVDYIPSRCIRTKRWKYIKNYSDNAIGLDQNEHMDWAHELCELPNHPWKEPRPKEELYDLLYDPYELNNLAEKEEYKEIKSQLEETLKQHLQTTEDPFLNKEFTYDYNAENYEKTETEEYF